MIDTYITIYIIRVYQSVFEQRFRLHIQCGFGSWLIFCRGIAQHTKRIVLYCVPIAGKTNCTLLQSVGAREFVVVHPPHFVPPRPCHRIHSIHFNLYVCIQTTFIFFSNDPHQIEPIRYTPFRRHYM